jgi:ribonucleotide monophosphatase NagD (HAD superfamily)
MEVGVIWKGHKPIEGVPQVLQQLKQKGKRILFVSNNSTKSRSSYVSKLASMGIACEPVCFSLLTQRKTDDELG